MLTQSRVEATSPRSNWTFSSGDTVIDVGKVGVLGSYLYSIQLGTSSTSWSAPQVVHSETKSSLKPWSTLPNGVSTCWNQDIRFSSTVGNIHPSYLLCIIRLKNQVMNGLIIFKNLCSRSLPDPKAIGFMGHSDERYVSVLTYQWQIGMVTDISA